VLNDWKQDQIAACRACLEAHALKASVAALISVRTVVSGFAPLPESGSATRFGMVPFGRCRLESSARGRTWRN
jgi:hypothetical protein